MAILDDTRADWNARPPLRTLTRVPWADRIGVSWHWLGEGKGPHVTGSHQKCLDQVRAWQGFHQQTRGWSDLGYNALICQHGRAIEGRGLEYAGAHSTGVNTSHVGVQFMVGNGDPFPSELMLARAVKLRADLGELGSNIRRDWGHRDDPKVSTACPGDALYKWVHSGGPTNITQEDDMPLTTTDIDKVADEVWTRPVYDAAGLKVTIGAAVGQMLRNSAAALELAKAQAQAGRPLSADETKAIVDAALDEKIEDGTGTVVLNARETAGGAA